MCNDIPEVLGVERFMEEVNEKINIYEGDFNANLGEDTISLRGSIVYRWLPKPEISWEGVVIDGQRHFKVLQQLTQWENEIVISTPNGFFGNALTTRLNIGSEMIIKGAIKRELKLPNTRIDKLYFHLTNFIDNDGAVIRHDQFCYRGRIELKHENYQIFIDKNNDYKKIYEDLKDEGGYSITHFGVIRKEDESPFEISEVEHLIDSISWLLSFASGRMIGISIITGHLDNKNVYQSYRTPLISNWKEHNTWFSKSNRIGSLEEIYPSFVEILKEDNDNNKFFQRVLTWYFDSMSSAYIENKVISAQIALEMIAWKYIIEDNAIIDGATFDKMRTSDKLRFLLYELSIPRDLPERINIEGYNDGPYLFTDYRNSIAHANKSKKFYDKAVLTRHDISLLGIQYLELSLLKLLDYKGFYFNRFSSEGIGVEKVPWV